MMEMKEKDYEYTIKTDKLSAAYIPGSPCVLFIKTGQGGSIYGDKNKYLDLATEVNKKYGFTVFVSSTFEDSKESYERDMAALDGIFVNKSYQIYYIGVSKGGLIGIWHGAENAKLAKILAINAPLMTNFYNKTRPAIEKLGEKLTMVYGTEDPSYKYLPFVPKSTEVKILDGADHNLLGANISLLELTEAYLQG